ncbi:MAG TPA: pilus assembly protein CpaE, partial [Hyphomonas sp.]|nr:pilus assembly protein CpaE [Hyphomonas sp.]
MSNENALFDDDFEDVFSEDSMSDHTPSDIDLNEVDDSVDQAVAEGAPMGLTADNDTHGLGHSEPSGGDVMLPAISIKLFYEREETRGLLEVSAQDRRMGRATVECIPGGIPAAIAYMSENPTPNLLMIESSESAGQVVREIDALAEHCDETVKVMVIGAVNDIMLYRQLIARGVSEYLVPPFQPLQIIRSIGELFVNPDSPFVGKQISVVGAKGGVGASTIAHNLSWALAENVKVNTTLVDLDLSFGTTALDFNQETPQTVADALLAPERADESVIERLLAKPTDRLSLFTAPATINQIMDIPDEAY